MSPAAVWLDEPRTMTSSIVRYALQAHWVPVHTYSLSSGEYVGCTVRFTHVVISAFVRISCRSASNGVLSQSHILLALLGRAISCTFRPVSARMRMQLFRP